MTRLCWLIGLLNLTCLHQFYALLLPNMDVTTIVASMATLRQAAVPSDLDSAVAIGFDTFPSSAIYWNNS